MAIKILVQTLRGTFGVLLLAATISVSGCATLHRSEDASESFSPDWSNSLRVAPANSELSGFSETSRQIERNLGFE